MSTASLEQGDGFGPPLRFLIASLQFCLMTTAWAGLSGGSLVLAGELQGAKSYLALLAFVVGWLGSIAIHEMGHVLGARSVGMTPFALQIGPLSWWSRSDGWRMRLARPNRHLSGIVLCHVNADRPLKGQLIRMLVCGPAANLLFALLLAGAGIILWPAGTAAFLCGLAAFNASIGLANLLPRQSRSMDNDGLQLLRWLRGRDESAPEFHLLRLNAMSIKGVTAECLPPSLIDELGNVPQTGPVFRLWFRMKAHQNLGEWASAVEACDAFENEIEQMPADCVKQLDAFIRQIRTEAVFSAAMASGVLAEPLDRHIDRELDWHCPALRPRCRALMAALAGDCPATLRHLVASERKMARSLDLAWRVSEARIRRMIRERCG
jgi:Zn-dependent protease